MDAAHLLQAYVISHNDGVRTGDYAAMLALFAPDAEMRFVDIPVGPFAGRDAIAAAFRERPPDDQLEMLSVIADGARATAVYGWKAATGVRAGTLILTAAGGLIRRLTISVKAAK